MTSFRDSHDYYKKMLDLQEKLRKSEEERIRLEERFKILVQESRNRHDACINRLRLKYIEFLEEQRTRDERNHKLIEALDRVDSSLALMTAKTDRLNVLRKQYEAYLRRAYAIRSPPRSIVGDDDVTSRNDHGYLRRSPAMGRVSLPSEIKNASTQQIFQPNYKTNISIPISATELIKPVQSTGYSNLHTEIPEIRTPNQQINVNQNPLGIPVDPIFKQNPIQQVSSQNLTSQISLYRQPNYSTNIQLVPRNSRIDLTSRVPYASTYLPIHSLSQPSVVPCSNRFTTERMETVQGIPYRVKSEHINDDISQHNLLDISQKQPAPIPLQRYINSSPVTQSLRQSTNETFLDSLPRQINSNNNNTPSISKVTPSIMDRSWTRRSFLNSPLSLSRQSPTNYSDFPSRSSDYYKRSISDIPTRSLKTPDIDDKIKRFDRFTPTRSLSSTLRQTVPEDVSKTTKTLENELDKYIDKIRKLHHDYDTQSLEEIDREQNKISDNLNTTLLENYEKLPKQEISKEDFPKEVEKVLALADDLASGTINLDTANDSGKERDDENRNLESIQATQTYTSISERSRTMVSGIPEVHATLEVLPKDKISYDIALHQPELDSRQSIENLTEQNSGASFNIHVPEQYEQQQPETQENENNDAVVSSDHKVVKGESQDSIFEENVQMEEQHERPIHIGDESNIEQYSFDALEELKPWNLDDVRKEIQEVDLIDEINEQSVTEESVTDTSKSRQDSTKHNDLSNNYVADQVDKPDLKESTSERGILSVNVKDEVPLHDTVSLIEEDSMKQHDVEVDEIPVLQHEELEHKSEDEVDNTNAQQSTDLVDDKINVQDEYEDNKEAELNETEHESYINQSNEQEIATQQVGLESQDQDYTNENYVQDANQMEDYAQHSETNYTDLNEQYNYDQNMAYENDQNQEYQEYANQEYPNQEYVQSNEQYEGYANEQYEQYTNETENQYEHDPNMQYQEDPNQQYAYSYDQQYDPNQVYETDTNQPFDYTESYNPEQTELAQEPEQSQEQEANDEKLETQVQEENIDTNQSNNEKLSTEIEPKKKKDVIKSLLDSDTDSTIERNVSNTESDFDFN